MDEKSVSTKQCMDGSSLRQRIHLHQSPAEPVFSAVPSGSDNLATGRFLNVFSSPRQFAVDLGGVRGVT
jgi:hypothetical protein